MKVRKTIRVEGALNDRVLKCEKGKIGCVQTKWRCKTRLTKNLVLEPLLIVESLSSCRYATPLQLWDKSELATTLETALRLRELLIRTLRGCKLED